LTGKHDDIMHIVVPTAGDCCLVRGGNVDMPFVSTRLHDFVLPCVGHQMAADEGEIVVIDERCWRRALQNDRHWPTGRQDKGHHAVWKDREGADGLVLQAGGGPGGPQGAVLAQQLAWGTTGHQPCHLHHVDSRSSPAARPQHVGIHAHRMYDKESAPHRPFTGSESCSGQTTWTGRWPARSRTSAACTA
jgi:hypothetical protein